MEEHNRRKTDSDIEDDISNPLNCPMYSNCHSVHASHQLLAEEVTQIKKAEVQASLDRKKASDNIKKLSIKLEEHTNEFKQTSIMISSNQKWMKLIAYSFGSIVTVSLIWLFAHANNADKNSSAINETLKNNTKVIERQNEYMRETVKELRTLNSKNIEAIIELKSKVNQIEKNQNRNYGQIQGLKSR